jgi:PIN domain nuclease of toxin-antitoxin system
LLSAASPWEMAIKASIGKLKLPKPFSTFIKGQLRKNGIRILPVKLTHTSQVASLPFHHRDSI